MLTAQLSKDIDTKWEACWPVSALKPLAVIDCIACLLFYKKLYECEFIINSNIKPAKEKLYYVNDCDELSWKNLLKLDAKETHILFTKENGIASLLKNYSHTSLPYSQFLKAPLLVNPSAVLLANTIEIIKIIEAEDDTVKGEIFEYLLHKEVIETNTGQLYCPEEIINALVSLIHPNDEIVCDPSCGNGDLLVSILSYFSKKDKKATPNQLSKKIIGFDADPVQLRIAAMNMMLHGIEQPGVFDIDALKTTDLFPHEKPVLLISNLYFAGTETELPVTSPQETFSKKKDIDLLNIILNNLTEGSRAAVIIRNYVLSNNILPEARTMRQRLIDNYNIDAIINIPDKAGSCFSGASILIFHSSINSSIDKICFYKMKPQPYVNFAGMLTVANSTNDATFNIHPETITATDFADIHDAYVKPVLTDSLYVNAPEIKNNNYNLDVNQYRKKVPESSANGIAKKFAAEMETIDSIATLKASKFVQAKEKLKAFFQTLDIAGIKKTIIQKFEEIKRKRLSIHNSGFKKINIEKFQKIKIKVFYEINKIFNRLQLKLKSYTTNKILLQEMISTGVVAILVLALSVTGLFFYYRPQSSESKTGNTALNISTKKIMPLNKINIGASQNKILTAQQIKAILKDTSGIIHVEDFANDNNDSSFNLLIDANLKNDDEQFKNNKNALLNAADKKVKYKVVDTTYFHDQPNPSSIQKIYLDPHTHAILTPLHESNGFIYIVYTNKLKKTSKGWIDKRYLTPVE